MSHWPSQVWIYRDPLSAGETEPHSGSRVTAVPVSPGCRGFLIQGWLLRLSEAYCFLLLSWLWIPGLHSPLDPIQMHISPKCSLELEQVGFGIKQAWVPMASSLSEGYSPDSSRPQEWWKMLISQDWCQDTYMYTNRCAYIHTVHIHTRSHTHTHRFPYIHIHINAHTHNIYTHISHIDLHAYTYIHMIHIYIHTHTCTSRHTHISHIYTKIHTHIYPYTFMRI